MRDPYVEENFASRLHVITVISNPERYRTRYKLFEHFEKMVKDSGAILHVIELAVGCRSFAVTDANNPLHIQIRTGDDYYLGQELWNKENLQNIALGKLPPDARYVAFVDADVSFTNPLWAHETVEQLQHFHVVQMFSHAQDVGPNHEPLKTYVGFVYAWYHDVPLGNTDKYCGGRQGHPGYAWAWRIQALNDVSNLIDIGILGSSDRHMAMGLIDDIENSYNPGVHPVYKKILKLWQVRARLYLNRGIGYVNTTLIHGFHGRKTLRKYQERWSVLVDEQFNPELDLKKDTNGLYQLTERNWRLRKKIRDYFRARSEDSIDLQ